MPANLAIRRVLDVRDVRVVYQPVVDLRYQRIFAYEALVRSKAPEFETPMSLFAAAVDHSCAGELGRLIREMAIASCPDHPLFLNVHPAELNERYIVQPDDPIFNHNKDVYLEITEGVPLSHFELCKSILSEVRGRGVYLVVDDLGAGYSNLKYIADLEPRVVKLDRELIAGLTQETRLFKLVCGIVVLCQELGATVVAEGIETPAELEAVVASGARYGQGYLLARPAYPPPEISWPGGAEPAGKTQPIRKKPPTKRPR
ncbi:MAG: EAL domain-containing protein [Deltaproteobacteria bacterium]|nr:EAL domain-containing protein [Deltaproteobacteria bacterium]